MQDREHHRAAEMVAEQSFATKSCSSRLQDMVAMQGCSTGCSTEGFRTGTITGLYQMVVDQEFSGKSCSLRLQYLVAAKRDAEQGTP
jgi:hypothetical protein